MKQKKPISMKQEEPQATKAGKHEDSASNGLGQQAAWRQNALNAVQDPLYGRVDGSTALTGENRHTSLQETADNYARVVTYFGDGLRVIECRDQIRWIIQRRKRGGAERPWRGVHYCTTQKALVRLCTAENPALPSNAKDILDAL